MVFSEVISPQIAHPHLSDEQSKRPLKQVFSIRSVTESLFSSQRTMTDSSLCDSEILRAKMGNDPPGIAEIEDVTKIPDPVPPHNRSRITCAGYSLLPEEMASVQNNLRVIDNALNAFF